MAHHLKRGYVENPAPLYYVDSATHDTGIVYQPDVYTLAEHLTELAGLTTIIDLGCGWGDKLAAVHARHPDWRIVGVDHGANYKHCAATYGWGEWRRLTLDRPQHIAADDALIICADVIEHLADPTSLLTTLRDSNARIIVLSTPERDLDHGVDHNGPPPNPNHVREWNRAELRALLESAGLIVRHLGLTRGCDQPDAPCTTTLTILEVPT